MMTTEFERALLDRVAQLEAEVVKLKSKLHDANLPELTRRVLNEGDGYIPYY